MTDNTAHKMDMMAFEDRVIQISKQLDESNEKLRVCQIKLTNREFRLATIRNIIDDVEYECLDNNTVHSMSEMKDPDSWFSKIKENANE